MIDDTEETITLKMSELREKHQALWEFTRFHIPWANGDLTYWLPIALAKIRYENAGKAGKA